MSHEPTGPDKWRQAQREASQYNFPWGPTFRIIGIVVVLVLVIGIIAGPVGLLLDWYGAGQRIVSPENVERQFRLAYDSYEGMEALAQQACNFEDLVAQASSDNERIQRQNQLVAVQNRYEQVRAQYEARYEDAFRAALVGPRDLPRDAPSLNEMQALVCSGN